MKSPPLGFLVRWLCHVATISILVYIMSKYGKNCNVVVDVTNDQLKHILILWELLIWSQLGILALWGLHLNNFRAREVDSLLET